MTNPEKKESGDRRTLAEMISDIRKVLAEAHVEPTPSKRAAILGCRTEIEDARERGLSWVQIAQLLEKAGISVSGDSVRTYVARSPARGKEAAAEPAQETLQPQQVTQVETPASPPTAQLQRRFVK